MKNRESRITEPKIEEPKIEEAKIEETKTREPKITDKKLRGEWAELVFMVRAAEHKLAISIPWGEMRSYDVIIGSPRRFLAVQVKSTTYLVETRYNCTLRGSGHRAYAPGSFDFLAAYLVFEDCWFIIPEAEILGMDAIHLSATSTTAKYSKYHEAWHLLEEPHDDGEKIEIQACAEEEFEAFESGLIQ
jgi:hypothetical protein